MYSYNLTEFRSLCLDPSHGLQPSSCCLSRFPWTPTKLLLESVPLANCSNASVNGWVFMIIIFFVTVPRIVSI